MTLDGRIRGPGKFANQTGTRIHRSFGHLLACGGISISILGLISLSAQAEPSTPGTHPDRWALTFSDDFNGTSLDTTKWEAATESRQGGKSTWDPAQVSVGNGMLRLGITKVVDPGTGATIRYDCGTVRGRKGYTSNYTFKQKYGYYEARYKLPARIDKDYWASFWLMAGPVGSGETDTTKAMEIDIMESFTFDRPVHTANFHWGGYGANHNKYSLDCGTWAKQQVLNPPGAYHVFGFYWDKDLYVFYLDGVEIGRTDMKDLGSTANGLVASQGTAQVEGYMLLSSEASTWPGDNSQGWDVDAPAQDEFLVDYVKAYDLKPAFASDPVIGTHAAENTAYQATLAGMATDVSGGVLTFAKVSGPAWLTVAANGALSGTPSGSDLGANHFDVSVSDGISTVQATLQIMVKSAFEVWSSGSAATFAGDANDDGVPDGVAWMLGSPSPGQSANTLLPAALRSADGGCTVSFTCLNAAKRGASVIRLQYSRDLGLTDPWANHTVTVPSISGTDPFSGVEFVIMPNGDINQVQATIPAGAADGGGRIFCRLQALPAP